LNVGANDGDVQKLGPLLKEERPGIGPFAWEVETSISADELPKTFERDVPARFERGSEAKVRGFLRGLYSANGSVVSNR
ncbi:hypothetical protein ACFMI9_19480, partial [Acinetobacter baumannii]|uniref:hypothetical protein n=1 Tax=Acinetobacter baumannii TaxID=470 RepID=UPI00366E2A75